MQYNTIQYYYYYYYYYNICIAHKFKHARVGGADPIQYNTIQYNTTKVLISSHTQKQIDYALRNNSKRLRTKTSANKAIVDITLRQLCAIPPPSSRILFVLDWHTDVISDRMIPVAIVAANATAKIANAFEWPEQPPKLVLPLPFGVSASSSNAVVL